MKITKEFLIQEYIKNKKSLSEVANIAGVSLTTIFRHMEKHGLQRRTVSESKKGIKFSQQHKENMSVSAIKRFKNKTERNKISLAQKKYWDSDNARDISGCNNLWFGIKRPDISERMKKDNPMKRIEVRKKVTKTNKSFSLFKESLRKIPEYKEWRKKIYQRDNYTCQWCNQIGGNLNADHIKSFSQILKENKITLLDQALKCEELWNLENGRTLCASCHRKTDTWCRG